MYLFTFFSRVFDLIGLFEALVDFGAFWTGEADSLLGLLEEFEVDAAPPEGLPKKDLEIDCSNYNITSTIKI